ncbi:hypothetical protein AB4043_21275, partial [Terriglobus sp. YAF25]
VTGPFQATFGVYLSRVSEHSAAGGAVFAHSPGWSDLLWKSRTSYLKGHSRCRLERRWGTW